MRVFFLLVFKPPSKTKQDGNKKKTLTLPSPAKAGEGMIALPLWASLDRNRLKLSNPIKGWPSGRAVLHSPDKGTEGERSVSVQFTPTDAPIGAYVTGLDMDRLSEADAEALREGFRDYGLLIFRGIGLDVEQQLALSHVFGPTVPHPVPAVRHPDEPMLIVLAANEGKAAADDDPDADKIVGVLEWHADTMYNEVPTRGALLQAITLPKVGGNTAWIDRHDVYKALPREVQAKIRGLQILYSYEKSHRTQGVAKQGEILFPDVISELVFDHPENGLPVLNLSPSAAKGILGLPEQEARELFDYLVDFQCREERAYVHVWEPGDAILWDNWRTLHKTYGHPKRYPRVMHRTTLDSDVKLGTYVTA
jgi:taurine dioxygenase